MAKLIAAQAAAEGLERAMQTMGGMGYAKEMHLERLWRDARLFRFAPDLGGDDPQLHRRARPRHGAGVLRRAG